jgi:hypothetical protein
MLVRTSDERGAQPRRAAAARSDEWAATIIVSRGAQSNAGRRKIDNGFGL